MFPESKTVHMTKQTISSDADMSGMNKYCQLFELLSTVLKTRRVY